jgi:stage V sporulation protein G
VEVTEVRIKLTEEGADRLIGFCSITLDSEFVVRDIKIIQGPKGPFVAMPSRKLTEKCGRCHAKNEVRANFCSSCGRKLSDSDSHRTPSGGQSRFFADIAHPINAACRRKIQREILTALNEERARARLPDYICTYDDDDAFFSPNMNS